MSRRRWAWTLAAFFAVGLGSYEGLRRYTVGYGKPARTNREREVGALLNRYAIPLTTEDYERFAEEAEGVTELAHWRKERAA